MRKRLFLCSFNLGLLLRRFGNFMFGFLCNEFFKFKEQNTDAELEGFALEIDMQNKTNYNNIRKYL